MVEVGTPYLRLLRRFFTVRVTDTTIKIHGRRGFLRSRLGGDRRRAAGRAAREVKGSTSHVFCRFRVTIFGSRHDERWDYRADIRAKGGDGLLVEVLVYGVHFVSLILCRFFIMDRCFFWRGLLLLGYLPVHGDGRGRVGGEGVARRG